MWPLASICTDEVLTAATATTLQLYRTEQQQILAVATIMTTDCLKQSVTNKKKQLFKTLSFMQKEKKK